jgi:hypothetical protein
MAFGGKAVSRDRVILDSVGTRFSARWSHQQRAIACYYFLLKYCTIESETWTFSQLVLLTNVNDFHYWWKLRPKLHAEDLSSQLFDFRHVSNYQRILQQVPTPSV